MVSFPQARVCLSAHPPVPAIPSAGCQDLIYPDLTWVNHAPAFSLNPSLSRNPLPSRLHRGVSFRTSVTSRPESEARPSVVRQFPHSLGRSPFMRVLTVVGMEAALVYDFLPTIPAVAALDL